MNNIDFFRSLDLYNHWKKQVKSLTREDILLHQKNARQDILNYAKNNSKLWSEKLKDIDVYKYDWNEIGFIEREVLTSRFSESITDHQINQDMVLEHFKRAGSRYLLNKYQVFLSAGKKGTLAPFVYDRNMWQIYVSSLFRRFLPANLDVDRNFRVAFIGTSDPNHTLTRSAQFFSGMTVSTFGLQEGINRCIEDLNIFEPDILIGFSSAIGMVAEAQWLKKLNIMPKAIFIGTDLLSSENRNTIKEVWGIEPLNSYASTEGGLIAFECEFGNLHINEDIVQVEIEQNRILVTNLVNRIQPFIKYLLPDYGSLSYEKCSCGLPYSILHPIGGRSNQILELPGKNEDKVKVHPIVIRSALDSISGILSSKANYENNTLNIEIEGDIDKIKVINLLNTALSKAGVNTGVFRLNIISK